LRGWVKDPAPLLFRRERAGFQPRLERPAHKSVREGREFPAEAGSSTSPRRPRHIEGLGQ